MIDTDDRLFDLLPVIHRQRDAAEGWPLRALLRVIAEQANLIEADIERLYENWFIETCEDWVVPYIGDLVGYRPVFDAGQPGDVTTAAGQARNKILVPRREVANTIAFRRRKSALALLELLSNQVAGWPARAVEFYRLLGWNQALNHLWLYRGRTADLRDGAALALIGGPFDTLARTVDVRRPNSARTTGRYNIPSVGLFVWRLKPYSVTRTAAYCLEDIEPRFYTFSALGNDAPLFTWPTAETDPTTIAGPLNVPAPITRRALEIRDPFPARYGRASPDYYGPDRSLAIWAPGWGGVGDGPIPAERIVPSDLSQWGYSPPRDHVAVDPETGRIAFHPRQLPRKGVWVRYHYGFSDDLGGGEYERTISQPAGAVVYKVGQGDEWEWHTIREALFAWERAETPPLHAVIEIQDSGDYVEELAVRFGRQRQTLQIRAANRKRPILRLLDFKTSQPDALSVEGCSGGRVTLDGLLISGRGVQVEGPLASLTIRHSTLVPGWMIGPDCEPDRGNEPSIHLFNTDARLLIDHSIVGSILITLDTVAGDPLSVRVIDSVLDATGDGREAISGPDCRLAHAIAVIERTTVFGEVLVHAVELGENSIFTGLMTVGRRQIGCLRFCYVPPGSRTPRRYRCQPDGVIAAVHEDNDAGPARDAAEAAEVLRVRPLFDAVRYGRPDYARLALDCAPEIVRGADDESEMGVFHDLYTPQRAANLRARLDEYAPAAMDAGIIYAS
jgi:hypothetical protein